jgi:acyl-CoA synthetase (AMP-forming)/AMP-acid ligase II
VSSPHARSRRMVKRSLGVGIVPRMRPDKSLRARSLVRRRGLTPAAAYGLLALRHPRRTAIIDELGALTFAQVQRRTDALAHAFQMAGIGDRDTVAIACANHRGLIEATVACSHLGADVLYLDAMGARTALARGARRADPWALVYDDQFAELMPPPGDRRRRFVAGCEAGRDTRDARLEQLIESAGSAAPRPPRDARQSTVWLARADLAPGGGNGPRRTLPGSLVIPAAVLSRIPLRARETTVLAAPISGSWGFLHLTLGLRLGSTLVLQRAFDPEQALASIARHRASALVVLPEQLEQIVELPPRLSRAHDTSSLRVIALRGARLPGDLALPAIERFGDVLCNLRGSPVVRLEGDWQRRARAQRRRALVLAGA